MRKSRCPAGHRLLFNRLWSHAVYVPSGEPHGRAYTIWCHDTIPRSVLGSHAAHMQQKEFCSYWAWAAVVPIGNFYIPIGQNLRHQLGLPYLCSHSLMPLVSNHLKPPAGSEQWGTPLTPFFSLIADKTTTWISRSKGEIWRKVNETPHKW